MAETFTGGRRRRLHQGSILALPAAVGVVLAAQALEGGTAGALFQGTAALVVGGGTLAATLISYAPGALADALRAAARSFLSDDDDLAGLTTFLVGLSVRAHRHGVLAIEGDIEGVRDPFLRNGLSMAVDGVEAAALREVLSAEMRARDLLDDEPARIFEAAAGYAPTFGILGAVLGLIHVMRSLATPSALGAGVAVAFVATVYGLGLANLFLLPIAGRLRERALHATRRRELILEGVVALRERMNPRLLAQAIRGLAPHAPRVEEAAARVATSGLQPMRVSS